MGTSGLTARFSLHHEDTPTKVDMWLNKKKNKKKKQPTNHRKLKLKYDPRNGGGFVSVFLRNNPIHTAIGDIEMLLKITK